MALNKIRLIGDIHGLHDRYRQIIRDCTHSVQVGDFCGNLKVLDRVNGEKHRILLGNHDNYDTAKYWPHFLGDYGLGRLNSVDFFYIRGAFSIDWQKSKLLEELGHPKQYWEEEQISPEIMDLCLTDYKRYKPDFVITHDCPVQIARTFPTDMLKKYGFDPATHTCRTQELLQSCFETYQPSLWIFGHFHQHIDITIGRTRFICLPITAYADVNEKLEIENLCV